jgi:anaerobic magnesium-protoporphyrin IX monomethyl ester cyclase
MDSNGNVKFNSFREGMNEYSNMPFPTRHLIPLEKYFSVTTDNNPITTVVTAKGCPYRCMFCYRNVEKVKYRTPNNIVDEMEKIKEMGIREVFFVDDTFYVNTKRLSC